MREFLKNHQSWIRRGARGRMGSRLIRHFDDSDLAQEASLQVLEGARSDVLHPMAYMRRVLQGIAARRGKVECAKGSESVLGMLAAGSTTPSASLAHREQVSDALAALNLLPAQQQHVVRLRLLSGLAFSICAERLNCTEAHARVMFHRALIRLRDKLGRE
jgi:RNA polymerase sigma factor (sigma-70 family)